MTRLRRVIKNLESLRAEKDSFVLLLLKQQSESIADQNREQLSKGKDANGKAIRPKYKNKRYAAKKQAMGSKAPLGTPDLKLTGKYHKSLKPKFTGKKFTIQSTDKKDKMLSSKYGDEIKGLNKEALKLVRKEIIPEIKTKLRERILR